MPGFAPTLPPWEALDDAKEDDFVLLLASTRACTMKNCDAAKSVHVPIDAAVAPRGVGTMNGIMLTHGTSGNQWGMGNEGMKNSECSTFSLEMSMMPPTDFIAMLLS